MQTDKERILYKKGRYLTSLLRHEPEKENFKIDKFGFVSVLEVCKALKITISELDHIIETNNKKRFIYSEFHDKIRATQGHSIKVELPLSPIEPPYHLYHGTTIDNKTSILKDGLISGKRNHVHLSKDRDTAFNVGMRHARRSNKVIIFIISAKLMHESEYKFYKSENGVWLTDYVPPLYLKNG